jgi:Protein of unknown function (DUF3892)
MADLQVTRTAKEASWTGGQHPHIATLCLANGSRVSKLDAIARIRAGIDSYYTFAGGLRANVEVIDRCDRCYSPYLRTDRDTTTVNNLLMLPDC